ncbi:hypothetical protein JCM19233_5528 [Vibrio astriarenae]|nr:hypothetical protein JCM19233_5528 [Vibrio sp. C7]
MKVKAISAIIASCLVQTLPAHASFVTSPDGSFGATLNFNGTIVDTNPDWAYQLDPSAEALARDWETTQNAGLVQSDGTLVFDFTAKGHIPFVQGYIESAASQGGVGLSPVVTITTSTGEVEVIGPNMPQGGITDVVLDVTEGTGGDQVASLQMQISGVTAGAVMYNGAYYWNEGATGFGTAQTAAAKALELLKTSLIL